jgi:DNA-binding transcriptional LysR family regulator
MNIHHLELFYYVAKHGGIAEAVRNIPYGIQQPAVSGQVAQLEEYLGVKLFQRRPFQLTAQGEILHKFIRPFFGNLDGIAAKLQGSKARQMRIGASAIVLREHLPELLKQVRKRYPTLRIALREGYQAELEAMLHQDELDLAVSIMEKQLAPGIRSVDLLDVPLVLLVAKTNPLASAEELWKRDRIDEPLICLPASEAVCKHFQRGLERLGVDWFPSIEASSLDLIEAYVADGFGIGVSVHVPSAKASRAVRVIPLPGFEPIRVGVFWRGRPSAILQTFLDEARLRARQLG